MATSPVIVGIGHETGVGKSYLARALAAQLERAGVPTRTVSFAEPLKDLAFLLFNDYGVGVSTFYEGADTNKKDLPLLSLHGFTPRDVWLRLGSAVRGIVPEYWVERLFGVIDTHGYRHYSGALAKVIIIPDVRFQNEIEAIRGRGGLLVRAKKASPSLDLVLEEKPQPIDAAYLWNFTYYNDFRVATAQDAALRLVEQIKDRFPHVVS